MTAVTWEALADGVAFPVRSPRLPPGWSAVPKAVVPGKAVLMGILDETGALRCSVSLHPEPPEDLAERQPVDVARLRGWWRYHFAEVPGARTVTNVMMNCVDFWACAAGFEDPARLAEVLSGLNDP